MFAYFLSRLKRYDSETTKSGFRTSRNPHGARRSDQTGFRGAEGRLGTLDSTVKTLGSPIEPLDSPIETLDSPRGREWGGK